MLSKVLKSLDIVNITIPCLFKTFFDIRCPGCGLTSASIHLLEGDINHAWTDNPLIFIIIPFSLYFVYKNYTNFINKK